MHFTYNPLCWLFMAGGALAKPSQIHLALGGRTISDNLNDASVSSAPGGMSVTWYTKEAQDAPTLYWGVSSSDLSGSLPAKTTAYLEGFGYHHSALIDDLPCSVTKVYYSIDDMDEVLSFKRPPCSPTVSFNVSIFGDMGYLDSNQRPPKLRHRDGTPFHGLEKEWSATYTRQQLEKMKGTLDLMWIVGDIGYVDDAFATHPAKFTYEEVYNSYMEWMENITSAIPLMVSPGNHESECHSPACVVQELKYGRHLSNFTAFNARFNMPSEESSGSRSTNMWYSWDYGSAHFISLNTETDFEGAEEEGTGDSHIPWLKAGGFGEDGEFLRWLEADLKKAHEAKLNGDTRWIIAGGHRPYDTIKDMEGVEGWFKEYGVDVYFAGHSHSYSRTTDVSSKPMYVVAGGAGCDEMGPPKDSLMLGPESSEFVTSDKYSSGVLTVSPDKLVWKLIDSMDGSVIDEVEIPHE
mmetsp:Transcript_6970/g.14518  ORF Transcript_6970/g.14518 Transcript_6970/m.14518 type:complete len:464 (+) Transcript_6970:59-1450(+)|eukprot:CAMPEP_0197545208 /NCGR_PEP_ID=MMETSP1320-20131121/343_1 /TAXON_ID=91990 /ORGANISM="Bolidomonas sp., Strain RCC2347" /LENGTH=463 /DNA_ID=CAMNT_0043104697 /DNA_START=59 /DNA_END=1450 /DNA_ORIENTATION=-